MVGAGKVDRVDHVGDASAAGDECGPLVDIAIPDLTGLIVACITGTEQGAPQAGLESLYGGLVKDCVSSSGRGDSQVCHGFPSFGWYICPGAALHLTPGMCIVSGVRSVCQLPCVMTCSGGMALPVAHAATKAASPRLARKADTSRSYRT